MGNDIFFIPQTEIELILYPSVWKINERCKLKRNMQGQVIFAKTKH